MWKSILKFFGLKKKQNESGLSQELKEEIANSINLFNKRKIYKEISDIDMAEIKDENLLQAIFDNISINLPNDYEREYESVNKLNKSKQAIYKIWMLEAEVNNGGFNQFYYNSSGQFYKELPESLKLIGASKFAQLVEKANNIYEENFETITESQDGSLEGFSESYKENPLDEFDDKFYELDSEENLEELQIKYIRNNQSDFINH